MTQNLPQPMSEVLKDADAAAASYWHWLPKEMYFA